MELCGALCLLWAVLGVLSAQDETKYLEVGQKLTLETISAIPKPITSIRWKYGSNLVVDWTSPNSLTYFGSFRGRTMLDTQTLRLDIDRVTLTDSGSFSLETNSGTYGTYNVKVIKPPPTPSIQTQLPQCNVTCALKCTTDTQDLGPVTYQWKMDEGEWTEGDELKSISSSDTTEKFFCRLRTRVSTSKTSPPMDNPLYKPVVPEPPPTPSIKTQPLFCEDSCALKCTADTQDLGPVTYQWKMDEGEWTEGEELKSISISDTTEKFFCRLRTRVRTSEASTPMRNPFNKPVPGGLYPDTILIIAIVVAFVVAFVILAGILAVKAMVRKCPDHPFSTWLKKTLPCVKQQDNSRKDTNANKADQTNTAAESLPLSSAAESHSLQPSDSIVFETGSKD